MYVHERTRNGVVSRLVSAIRVHRARRGAIRDLRRMSDLQLADIGIERHRIPEVVAGLMAQNAAKHKDRRVRHDGCPAAGGEQVFFAYATNDRIALKHAC